jgi:hypothetical protein
MNQSMRQMVLAVAVGAAIGMLPVDRALARGPMPDSGKAPPAVSAIAAPVAQNSVAMPVREVVLYSSGVGYFEHYGTVNGDASAELPFKATQINDVLKSLVLEDLDGGKISAVTYPSQDPLAKTLRSFQVDITANPPLADLLNQLRGVKIAAHLQGNEEVSGIVLEVETRIEPAPAGQSPVSIPVLNVLTGATIKQVELNQVNDLTFADPTLQEELEKALGALAQSRDQDKKPVTIVFNGRGERGVRIGYVVSTPIWKTSYRLLLSGDEKQKPSLQGWAIVENQTDSDWNNVQLSLVSGRPISFVENLYQPLYVPRPIVEPELFASLRPTLDTGGIDTALSDAKDGAESEGMPAEAAAPGMGPLGQNREALMQSEARSKFAYNMAGSAASQPQLGMSQDNLGRLNASSSIVSIASAAHLGELFEYTVGNVTLSRQKSAMLPIITDPIEIERLSIYNQSVLPNNPLYGARVKNTTGKHLLAGPMTVLDNGSYAGDAQIDNLPPGQERLVSYGVDLEMKVLAEPMASGDAVIQTARIDKGVLVASRKFVSGMNYTADNKSDKDKTLIVEHPKQGGWTLVNTAAPIETTESVYRFKIAVPAGKTVKLLVSAESTQDERIEILPCDADQLAVYFNQGGKIPAKVHDAIGKALDMKRALADTQRQIEAHDQQMQQIDQEQNRIRENMRTVGRGNAYYDRLLKKLDDQEDTLETLQKEKADLQTTRDQQQKDLENYVGNLNMA